MSYYLVTSPSIKELVPPLWRIRNILPTTGLASIYGPSTSGKSFLALDMAAAIASGQSWFGQRVRPAPVVYVALEGEAGFRLRICAWETAHDCSMPDQLFFLILQPFKLTDPIDVAELANVCPQGSVIIIDTLNRSAPTANENESHDMGLILESSKRLQHLTNSLVILIHHTGKDESRGMRGHSSLIAAMDAAIEVSRLNEQREWTVAKSKDGQDGASFGFRLSIEELEYDEYGDVVTSCSIQPSGGHNVIPSTPTLGGNQKQALSAISDLLNLEGRLGNPGVPPNSRSILYSSAVTATATLISAAEPKRKNARAKEAINSLIKQDVFKCNGDFIWLEIGPNGQDRT
jgi:putative DNA primase/helicase